MQPYGAGGRRSWLPLVVISLSGLVTIFNVAASTTTIGAVVLGLDTTASAVQLAIVAYSVLVAAFAVDGGKLSSLLGVVPTHLAGLAIYALGMATAGCAPSVRVLITGQAIAGVGGALLNANSVAILGQAYVGRQQTLAVSVQAGLTGVGASLGLLLGGALVTYVSWRGPYLLLVGVLLVTFPLAAYMKLPKPTGAPARLDGPSVALAAFGVILLIGAVNQIGSWGLLAARSPTGVSVFGLSPVLLLLLAGAMLLRLFLNRQRHLRSRNLDPLLAPEVTGSPIARASLSCLLHVNMLLAGVPFLLLLYAQVVLGRTAIGSAMTLLPLSLALLVGAVASAGLGRVLSPRAIVVAATLLAASGAFLLAGAVSNEGAGPPFWTSEVLLGIGLGGALPVGDTELLKSVPRTLSGDVGSARAVAMYMGSAIGTALAGAVLLSALASNAQARVDAHPELVLPASVELSPTTVRFVSNDELRPLLSAPPWHLNEQQLDEAVRLNVDARLVALRASLAVMGLLMLSGLFGVWFLPSEKESQKRAPTRKPSRLVPSRETP